VEGQYFTGGSSYPRGPWRCMHVARLRAREV
jgi:hypothetical protein